jgi:hypothetical protein
MESLSTRLSAQQTFLPSMTQLFIHRLTAWRNQQEVLSPKPIAAFLATAYREQSDIGRFNFLQGCLSNHWVAIQSNLPTTNTSKAYVPGKPGHAT